MSIQTLNRFVALLFVVVGVFLFRLGNYDPAPRSARQAFSGIVEQVASPAERGTDVWCEFSLVDLDAQFVVRDRVELDAALRADLGSRVLMGALVELDCTPESGRGAGAPGSQRWRVVRLTADGTLVYDLDAANRAGRGLLRFALGAAGAIAIALGVGGMWRFGRSS